MNNIKNLRITFNLNQNDFAKILNVNRSMISEYENEVTDISTDNLVKLADYFNTSTDYVLGITDDIAHHLLTQRKNKNRLKELRKHKKLTQDKISKDLYIVQTSYSRYESGIYDIPTNVLIKLGYYYKTSIDYLLCRTDDKTPYQKVKSQ